MVDKPLAYFLTFTTYGAWLHGQSPGSVDREHNQFSTPLIPADDERQRTAQALMREAPYTLDAERRAVVLKTIMEVALHRGWTIWAVHVRSNHVHVVVTADVKPEKAMADFKAYASRRLREQCDGPAERTRWTQHGSTRYLWTHDDFAAKIEYVVNGQGEAMAVFDARTPPDASEPEA